MVSSDKPFRKDIPSPDIVGAIRERVTGNFLAANTKVGPDRNDFFDNKAPFEFYSAPGVAYDPALSESDGPQQSFVPNNIKSDSNVAATSISPNLKPPVHKKSRPPVLPRALRTVAYGFFAIVFFGVLVLYLGEHLGPRADAVQGFSSVQPSTAAQEAQLQHRFETITGEVDAIRQTVVELATGQDRLEEKFSQLQAAEQQEISQLKAAERQELSRLQAAEQELSQSQASQPRHHRYYRR